jgi:pentapeptide MXKDX repeat protein
MGHVLADKAQIQSLYGGYVMKKGILFSAVLSAAIAAGLAMAPAFAADDMKTDGMTKTDKMDKKDGMKKDAMSDGKDKMKKDEMKK